MSSQNALPPKGQYTTQSDATNLAMAIVLVNDLKKQYNLLVKSYNQLLSEKVNT